MPNDDDCIKARSQELAIWFIRGTNTNHKGYLCHLRNSYLDRCDNYPRTVHEAYNILRQHEEDLPPPSIEGDGVSFAQNGQRWDMSNASVTAANRWDIMQIHQNAPTTNQARTKAMTQMTRTARQPHKEEMESTH